MTSDTMDQERLDALLGRFVEDLGASFHSINVVIGDRLGLYRALAETGPATSGTVAQRAGCAERYVREWLRGQAAGGYVTFHSKSDAYSLTPEQRFALADEDGLSLPGAFMIPHAASKNVAKLIEAFRSGDGMGWHEHDGSLFAGTERFFRPGYNANLVSAWLPALDGVVEKLRAGARVADVGCGYGTSTILMAQAFPASTFAGFDYHEPSIEVARKNAAAAGVADRVTFEVAAATDYPGEAYDLVAIFDALHDMGDPVGASAHVHRSLASDGTFMLVEPRAEDAVEDNLNAVGRVYYNASTLICTPNALSQDGRVALGAQAGEARLSEVLEEAGFAQVRRAADTPFNIVLEARP